MISDCSAGYFTRRKQNHQLEDAHAQAHAALRTVAEIRKRRERPLQIHGEDEV